MQLWWSVGAGDGQVLLHAVGSLVPLGVGDFLSAGVVLALAAVVDLLPLLCWAEVGWGGRVVLRGGPRWAPSMTP